MQSVDQKLSVVHVPIDDLRPDPANPRRISDAELDSLTRSIRQFGFVDPVIARREDKVVIGGHQRLLAARRLGLASVPVILLDLSGDQARLLNLALNRISGSWDEELPRPACLRSWMPLPRLTSPCRASTTTRSPSSSSHSTPATSANASSTSIPTPPSTPHRPTPSPNLATCGAWAITGCYAAIRPTPPPWGASSALRKPR